MRPPITIAVLVLVAAAAVLAPSPRALAEPCSDGQLARILEPAVPGDTDALVDCDLDLTPELASGITRRLVLLGAASRGVTVDCHGGVLDGSVADELDGARGPTILIASRRVGESAIPGVGAWEPPTDVTIRDCEVLGAVRLRGVASFDEQRISSYLPVGHVARMRAAAPQRVTLEGLTIVGNGQVPLYVGMGSEDTTILRSHVTGTSPAVAIYLDSESTRTTIRSCVIDTETRRELIAIDGSSENRILDNWLSNLEDGGIELYRNCGERGVVRFTTPSYNEIIDNVFYYDRYTGPNAAVFIGSQNGETHRFCGHDDSAPYGSGGDDTDYAIENAVMQNQFYVRSPHDMIVTGRPEANRPNYVEANVTVTRAIAQPTGCFVLHGYRSRFLPHGESIDLFRDPRGRPYWSPIEQTCVDGDLELAWDERGRLEEVPFSCSAESDPEGCRGTIACPGLGTLVGASAACNLERPEVTAAQIARVPGDTVRVVRASDRPWEGACWVGRHVIDVGERPIAGELGTASERFGCREHDRNGGDCAIRGVAYCYYPD